MVPVSAPTSCPDPGLTFQSNGKITISESSLLVGVDHFRTVDVVVIDCFPGTALDPGSVLSSDLKFDSREREKLERVLNGVAPVHVTIPEPNIVSRDWLSDLDKDTPKPGHVWIDSAETVTDLLLSGILSRRSPAPPYPNAPGDSQAARPAERPEPGLTLRIRPNQIVCEGTPDCWRVTSLGGDDLVVSLLDCYVDPEHYLDVCKILESGTTMAITLPPPVDSVDWLGSLRPNSVHAGWIWLNEHETLNSVLVGLGIGTEFPF